MQQDFSVLFTSPVSNLYLATLSSINDAQEGHLRKITKSAKGRLKLEDGPPTKADGLYWLYTSYKDEDLRASQPSPKRKAVPVNRIASEREGLDMVCNRRVGEFRLVYNGIGGLGIKGYGGLRERILEEFRGGDGTGSLAICDTSLNDLERWRYSFILWPEITHAEKIEYLAQAVRVETLWRLHFGWPILCIR
ncbi:hypothetical protein V9K97_18365 [Variovorax sp. CCNWLW186]|uniref:hypothetical protein n=1 Tax=Variovorax sp. CCNWLW186 TaxID=3127473 RepID=UPI0030775BF6